MSSAARRAGLRYGRREVARDSAGPAAVGAPNPMRAGWVKRRWKCDEPGCARKAFTEGLPQVLPPMALL